MNVMKREYVIGVDFGSDSARAILADVQTGEICQESVAFYPRWKKGLYCNSIISQYRQHPLDYIEAFIEVIRNVALGAEEGSCIKAIALDTTGSTPCPVNRNGTPLALLPEFSDNPNAMFWLWKDHTSLKEAEQLTDGLRHASSGDFTVYQGTYSAEWFWAKVLHGIRIDPDVRKYGYTWVEHVDWLSGFLVGKLQPERLIRCSCAAGHKAYWDIRHGGLPDLSCFTLLDGTLGRIVERYRIKPQPAGKRIGTLTKEWAGVLGLEADTVVGTGSFDAHAGAVGAGIRPHRMVKIVGTSTVDLLTVSQEEIEGKDMRSYCNQALDSILPGMVGIEAGQAAFGDLFSWLKRVMMWPVKQMGMEADALESLEKQFFIALEKEAGTRNSVSEAVSIDWFNGRRYPDNNEAVKGAFLGLSLGTDCVDLYRALVRGAIFGSKRILDSFAKCGLKPQEIVAVGGIADKSHYIMQQMANILELPIKTLQSGQVCALGAAVYGAVAAGIYPSLQDAQQVMCPGTDKEYLPDGKTFEENRRMYGKYQMAGSCVEQWTQQIEIKGAEIIGRC